MPNKPHPPRSKAGKSTQNNASNLNGEDTSFIVFGDSKSKTKGKGTSSSTPPSTVGDTSKAKKGKPTDPNTPAADGPKKPDTRTLIAGSSWTGKLPLNLFAEHCQRQKWEKPEYTMSRSTTPPGQYSTVILRRKNPKSGEITSLPPIGLPPQHKALGVKDSAVEARHFAACWALYRVGGSGKNLAMALPPQYRDLWKGDFVDMKKEEEAGGRGWLFEADPFVARTKHEEDGRAREKERAEREERREKERKEREEGRGVGMGKGWGRAPRVDMGRKMRGVVEGLVRKGTVWNANAVALRQEQKRRIVEEVSAVGFRKTHVEEAVEECKDKEETLEWLMIHVPEDDLPAWCLPENYTAGISLASGDMQRENKIKRLATAGYATEVCDEVLTKAGDDEVVAAETLQNQLLGVGKASVEGYNDKAGSDDWSEEMAVLESIYGDRCKRLGSDVCRIDLEVPGLAGTAPVLQARRPKAGYPHSLPTLSIEAKLPAYIRLSIIKQALQDGMRDLIGEQMMFSTVDWLEQNIPRIVENPGTLRNISSAVGVVNEVSATEKKSHQRRQHRVAHRSQPNVSERLLAEWRMRQESSQQKKMLSARQKLPAWQLQTEIVESVNSSQVTIISGETGSGKSTQSVQFILDDMIRRGIGSNANMICTQPRRISALGLADRVADERCSQVGNEVGYSIRGESRQTTGVTKITFVTTGVLLRRLQSVGEDEGGLLSALDGISHIVIDEVHERSLDTDFLMTLLRDTLSRRKDLKLILMSATLDAELFENYFKRSATVSKVQIAGRTHPVTDIYLEDVLRLTHFVSNPRGDDADDETAATKDIGAAIRAVGTRTNYDLIAQLTDYIDQALAADGDSDAGSILIFLPGVAEIDRALTAIRRVSSKFYALPLHASLMPVEQRKVFGHPPRGCRKIIATTNVAETSITIDDVVAVVDTGRVKETFFDPQAGMVKLEEVWASKAACKQRRGRAGRVKAGTCYKLFTKNLEQTRMAERPEPEIRRVPLEQLCLSVKAMGMDDVRHFLTNAITPPESLAIDAALSLLDRMGILDSGALTALGRHLALIPADLRCGKLMVLGSVFGCLESCLTIASILSVKSPFVSPQDKREEAKTARAAFQDGSGDLVCDLRAFQQWSDKREAREPVSMIRGWCGQNFLSYQTLQDIANSRAQYLSALQDIQFVPYKSGFNGTGTSPSESNNAEGSIPLLRALIAASFSPQVARIEFPDAKYIASVSGSVAQDPEARTIKFFSEQQSQGQQGNERVFIHPSSTLFSAQTFPTNTAFMSFFTKMSTSKVFMRDLTPCNAYSLLLFCGSITLAAQTGGGLLIDGWIRIKGWARIGVLISRLRAMFDQLLLKKLEDPDMDLGDQEVIKVVRRLVELNGMDN